MRPFLIIALLAGTSLSQTTGTWEMPASSLSVVLAHESVTTPTWTRTGSLTGTPGTSTLLQNGKVLAVGSGVVELYDPETGQWSLKNNLIAPRGGHVAVRLANGNVLIIGGRSIDDNRLLTSAETFDPTTGLWSPAGDLSVPREHHTANLLTDGTVLVIGGQFLDRVRTLTYTSAEIYDPATGEWSSAGTMPSPHAHHASTVLANGKVLVIGGDDQHVNQHKTALFDPVRRTWTATGDAISARWQPRATLLSDGKVLVAGGDGGMDAAELYDPASGQWSATGRMITRRREHSLTLLPDGKVLAAGGHLDDEDFFTGEVTVWGTAELYDPVIGQWSLTASMNEARYLHTATLLDNGKLLVTGGCINGGCLNTAELFDSGTNAIDFREFFVRRHYLDFLNREPDSQGLAFWSNEINVCGGDFHCVEVRRISVSAAFFLSIEFQETGYLVYRFYKASYGDVPGTPVPIKLSEFLPDTRQIGEGVIVNQPGWQTVLENNKQEFVAAFVQREQFTSVYQNSMSPADFVDTLFANAGVTPFASDRTAAIAEFGGAGHTSDTAARARALRRVAENSTLREQEFNKAFVLMQYFGYLRRNPNDAPDGNFDGFNFWLNKLNAFNGNFIEAEMVKAFISSIEYRQRFGP